MRRRKARRPACRQGASRLPPAVAEGVDYFTATPVALEEVTPMMKPVSA
jgi:hypothetical protein